MSFYEDTSPEERQYLRRRATTDIPHEYLPEQVRKDAEIGFPIQEPDPDPMPMAESIAKADTSPRTTRFVSDHGRSKTRSFYQDTPRRKTPRQQKATMYQDTSPVRKPSRQKFYEDKTPQTKLIETYNIYKFDDRRSKDRFKSAEEREMTRQFGKAPTLQPSPVNLDKMLKAGRFEGVSERERIARRGGFTDTISGKALLEAQSFSEKKGTKYKAGEISGDFLSGLTASGEAFVRPQTPDMLSMAGGLTRRGIMKTSLAIDIGVKKTTGKKHLDFSMHELAKEKLGSFGAEAALQTRSVGFGKDKAFSPAWVGGAGVGESIMGFGIGKGLGKASQVVAKTPVISKFSDQAIGKVFKKTGISKEKRFFVWAKKKPSVKKTVSPKPTKLRTKQEVADDLKKHHPDRQGGKHTERYKIIKREWSRGKFAKAKPKAKQVAKKPSRNGKKVLSKITKRFTRIKRIKKGKPIRKVIKETKRVKRTIVKARPKKSIIVKARKTKIKIKGGYKIGKVIPRKPTKITPQKPTKITPQKPTKITPQKPRKITPQKPRKITTKKPRKITGKKPPKKKPRVPLIIPPIIPKWPKRKTTVSGGAGGGKGSRKKRAKRFSRINIGIAKGVTI